jgi:hypothetical protein
VQGVNLPLSLALYGGVRILKFINWYFGIISDLDLGN